MVLKSIYQENYDGFTDKVQVGTGFSVIPAPEEPSNPNEGDFSIGGNGYFGGNVGIGTTNSGSCGKLEVIGTICATNFNSTSDIKFKTDIEPIKNPLELVNNMNGVYFKWIENENHSYGFIAQELEKVTPELIGNGNYKTINYSGVIPILVESIKELQTQVEELKSQVQRLQSCTYVDNVV